MEGNHLRGNKRDRTWYNQLVESEPPTKRKKFQSFFLPDLSAKILTHGDTNQRAVPSKRSSTKLAVICMKQFEEYCSNDKDEEEQDEEEEDIDTMMVSTTESKTFGIGNVLSNIISHLSIVEIIKLRRVNKLFNNELSFGFECNNFNIFFNYKNKYIIDIIIMNIVIY